jgi:hypothetical protein
VTCLFPPGVPRLPRARARTRGEVPTLGNGWSTGAYLGPSDLGQLIEREGECGDASSKHDESECRDAFRN